MAIKGRFIRSVEYQLSPILREAAAFIEEHIGINVFKYLPLLLFWYWLLIVTVEEFIKSHLAISFIFAITVTLLIVSRDIRKRYHRKKAKENEVLVKDQEKDSQVHN